MERSMFRMKNRKTRKNISAKTVIPAKCAVTTGVRYVWENINAVVPEDVI